MIFRCLALDKYYSLIKTVASLHKTKMYTDIIKSSIIIRFISQIGWTNNGKHFVSFIHFIK